MSWPDPADPLAVAEAVRDADVLVSGTCTADHREGRASGCGWCTPPAPASTGSTSPRCRPGTLVANTFHHEDSIAEYVVAAAVLLRRGFLPRTPRCAAAAGTRPRTPRRRRGSALARRGDRRVRRLRAHRRPHAGQRFRAFGARGVAVTRRGDVDAAATGLEWSGTTDDLGTLLDRADVVVVVAVRSPTETTRADRARRTGPHDAPAPYWSTSAAARSSTRTRSTRRCATASIGGAAIDVWYDYPARR